MTLTTAARRSKLYDAEVEKAERGDVVVFCHEGLLELWTAGSGWRGQMVRRWSCILPCASGIFH